MTDLAARLRAANPLAADALGEHELAIVWRALELRPPVRRGRPVRRVAVPAAATAAAAVAALALVPGAARTPAAQAFPILRQAGTDVRGMVLSAAGTPLAELSSPGRLTALQSAHPFPMPTQAGFTMSGYVLQSADGSTLCLLLSAVAMAGRPEMIGGGCGEADQVEQSGLITALPYDIGGCGGACVEADPQHEFAALVPQGASVTLTQGGATTPVPVSDGVATGVLRAPASLTITNSTGVPLTQNYVVQGTVPLAPIGASTASTGAIGASTASTGATGASTASTGAIGASTASTGATGAS